jgi:hypothetical protein
MMLVVGVVMVEDAVHVDIVVVEGMVIMATEMEGIIMEIMAMVVMAMELMVKNKVLNQCLMQILLKI